jgi:hypothetical protein
MGDVKVAFYFFARSIALILTINAGCTVALLKYKKLLDNISVVLRHCLAISFSKIH